MAATPGIGGRGTGGCEDAWGPGNARGCEPSGGGISREGLVAQVYSGSAFRDS